MTGTFPALVICGVPIRIEGWERLRTAGIHERHRYFCRGCPPDHFGRLAEFLANQNVLPSTFGIGGAFLSLSAFLTVKQEKSRAVRFVLRFRRHAALLQKRPGQRTVTWRKQKSIMRIGFLKSVSNRTICCGILYAAERQTGIGIASHCDCQAYLPCCYFLGVLHDRQVFGYGQRIDGTGGQISANGV